MFEKIFHTVIEISLGTSVVIFLFLVTKPLLDKRYSAKWRYCVWLILALRLIIPFRFSFSQTPVILPVPEREIVYGVDESKIPDIPKPEAPKENVDPSVSSAANVLYQQQMEHYEVQMNTEKKAAGQATTISKPAAIGWLVGAFFFLTWHISIYFSFRMKIRRRGKPSVDPQQLSVYRNIRSELGVKRNIRLAILDGIGSPMMIGIISPLILLPNITFSEEDLSMILRHELIHWKRRDMLYKFILLLSNAAHWFNPLVWIMVRKADQDIEISCDDAVLKGKDDFFRRQYGQALLCILKTGITQQSTIFSTHFSVSKKTLKRRFYNLFRASGKRFGKIAFSIVLSSAILAGNLVACGQKTPPPKDSDSIGDSSSLPAASTSSQPSESVSPANPDTLESVSALSLQGEKVAQIKSFSFYVKNTDTGEILSPDDLDQFGAPPKGQVIAVQNGSDTGYVIGSFSFPYERYGWGSISDLQDGTFYYTNGKQLFFYDATTLEPLEQKLDFQTPSEPYWHIASVYYDQALKNYAVLYHVSSFLPSSEELPWEVWDDDNQKSNVHTEIQKFDVNGTFAERAQTTAPAYDINTLSVCQPGQYHNGFLEFQVSLYGGYASYDFSAKNYAFFRGVPLFKGDVVLLYNRSYQNDTEIFTYEWMQEQKSLYQVSVPRKTQSLTDESTAELIALDPSAKTASFKIGNIRHDINFLSGSGKEVYVIDENQLTRENLTHTSPDGRYEVYHVGHSAGGDGWADEFICRDTISGQVQQLGVLSASQIGGITGKNELIYLEWHTLYSIDLATGEHRQPVKALSAPVDHKYKPGDPYLLDFVYDAENHVIIAECVDWFDIYAENFDINAIEETLYLLVFDENWNQQKQIDTTVPARASFQAYGPTGCDLILQSDGLYLEKGSYGPISYLE